MISHPIVRHTKTRGSLKCPLIGYLCDLNSHSLPLKKNIVKYYLFVECHIREKCQKSNTRIVGLSEISVKISEALKKIWISASLPTITEKGNQKKVKDYFLKSQTFLMIKSQAKIALFR